MATSSRRIAEFEIKAEIFYNSWHDHSVWDIRKDGEFLYLSLQRNEQENKKQDKGRIR